MSYFDHSDALVREMVDLQLRVRKKPLRALDYIEKDKARIVLDWIANLHSAPGGESFQSEMPVGSIGAEEIAKQLPKGVTVVEYFFGAKSLEVWVIGNPQIVFRTISLNPEHVRSLCQSLQRAISSDSKGAFLKSSTELYDMVVRPIEDLLPVNSTLVLIPDGCLTSVPFSALFDQRSHRYLFEQWASSRAPSLNVFFRAANRGRLLRVNQERGRNALVVGDPAFDRRIFRSLPRLPMAAEEAARVAATLINADLMVGDEATKSQFLARAVGKSVIHFAGHAMIQFSKSFFVYVVVGSGAFHGRCRDALRARDCRPSALRDWACSARCVQHGYWAGLGNRGRS
ncbi:MAG: CHAT domain-containing protein [Thermoanaerobaculia bacterium]